MSTPTSVAPEARKRNTVAVNGYRLAAGRHYDRETHLWVETSAAGAARCGFDPLGSETSGDVVALSFEPIGKKVERGEAFGSLEAAKFVGPLIAPLSGTIARHNQAVIARPGLLNQDPLAHWLIEIEPDRLEDELPLLLHDPADVSAWFEREIERFKQEGMVGSAAPDSFLASPGQERVVKG